MIRGDTPEDSIELKLADCIGRSTFINMLCEADIDGAPSRVEEQDEVVNVPPLEVSVAGEGLSTSIDALLPIKSYLENFGSGAAVAPSRIRAPLPGELQDYVSPWEMEFINSLLDDEDPWQHDRLLIVLSIANRLGISSLQQLLSAWCAEQIGILSKGKSSMDAAEAVRSFFSLPNEWTSDETHHLEMEMEYFDSLNDRR